MNLLLFIRNHFAHVAPILMVGAFGFAIILERLRALVWTYPFPEEDAFFSKIKNLVIGEKISDAIALCDRFRSKPGACVVKEGLLRAHEPEAVIEHGLQVAIGEAHDRIQLRTGFLSMIANVATLLGLLGTILGLIQSFEAVGSASAQMRSALLASGISMAMNATMLGLGVAIPCMVAYSFLMSRTNRLNAQIERSAVRILELLKSRYYAAESVRNSSENAESRRSA